MSAMQFQLMDACSDTVVLASSIGRQTQSTKSNQPAFSFGTNTREKAMKSSLSHAEKTVPLRNSASSFGKQLTSNVATASTFHFGTASQQDDVKVDQKLKNCADNLAKKEERWKHHVAFENKCYGMKGAEDDRSEYAPLFMQSTIRARQSSPFYKPNHRVKKETHTRFIYHGMAQCHDPISPLVTERSNVPNQLSARPLTAESLPRRSVDRPRTAEFASNVPALSLQQSQSQSSLVLSPMNSRINGTTSGRPISQRSRRSQRSRPRTSGGGSAMGSVRSSANSRESQRQQVQDWIQTEFGKCGDELFQQINTASSSIASNNTRLGSMLNSLQEIERKF